jgi:hypothetical protein
MAKHFIIMAGLHGCIPQYCASHDTYAGAVEDGIALSDICPSGPKAREFRKNGYVELNIHRDGNEYMEIEECNCDTPEIHNDD